MLAFDEQFFAEAWERIAQRVGRLLQHLAGLFRRRRFFDLLLFHFELDRAEKVFHNPRRVVPLIEGETGQSPLLREILPVVPVGTLGRGTTHRIDEAVELALRDIGGERDAVDPGRLQELDQARSQRCIPGRVDARAVHQ